MPLALPVDLDDREREREPRDRVDRVGTEEVRVGVPGRREPQGHVHREAPDRGGEHRHPEERAEPDRDLEQRDPDTGEHRHLSEDAHQRSRRCAAREPGELRPDVVASAGSEEVRIEELLDPGEQEGHTQEGPEDPDRPRHLDPALGEGARPGGPPTGTADGVGPVWGSGLERRAARVRHVGGCSSPIVRGWSEAG
jgi:hypothetical protein